MIRRQPKIVPFCPFLERVFSHITNVKTKEINKVIPENLEALLIAYKNKFAQNRKILQRF
jgi:Fe-S-cluster-containing dehydrogenase component